MRHENNFGEVRLPDGEGLRLEVAITDPREACECATAWIGEADQVIETANAMVQGEVLEQAARVPGPHAAKIIGAGQSVLAILTLARRELALASSVVGKLYPLLPTTQDQAPPLRRAVIDLRQKTWDRALAEYIEANADDARIEDGPDGVYTDQAPAKFAALLATPAPTTEAFHTKFEIVMHDIFADDAADPRFVALAKDHCAIMARQSRNQTPAEAA